MLKRQIASFFKNRLPANNIAGDIPNLKAMPTPDSDNGNAVQAPSQSHSNDDRGLNGVGRETSLDRARRLRENGELGDSFALLRSLYREHPSDELAAEMCQMIGTSSTFEEVQTAMDLLFNNDYYLSANPDVRAAFRDGSLHYLIYGWKEHRNPSMFFDHAFYRVRNANITATEFPLSHFVKNGRTTGEIANPISDRYWFTPFLPTEEQWDSVPAAKINAQTEAVVVIPVFKGLEDSLTAIYHALWSRFGARYAVLVVNDKGPDRSLNDQLRRLAAKGLFEYHVNSVNRGFVQTCNLAINQIARDYDIVLLNADAYVFPNWYERLRNHAQDPHVATVTPLSNNATICSYPLINHDNALALECTPQQLDVMAAKANAGLAVEAPTGVGFCFYMKRSVIKEIGVLDPAAFKVGYGEENDFCMRAMNAGYKNLIAGDVFVFHTGSVSFSSIKEENFARGQKALERKHPNYSPLVRSHIVADPEAFLRRTLDVARLTSAFSGAVVFVSHRWGGGINTYLAQQQKELEASGRKFVSLLVHDGHKVSIETHYKMFLPNLVNLDLRTELKLVSNVLVSLEPALLHVNSFAGLEWFWQKELLNLIEQSGIPFKYIAHDYSSISHHYQLLRPDNFSMALPSLEDRRRWATMNESTWVLDVCDPDERLEVYKTFFAKADAIEVPSRAACAVLSSEFPGVNFEVVRHADHLPDVVPAKRRGESKSIKLVIVGAIGPHKGSDVVAALASDAINRKLSLEYHLVGYRNNDVLLRSYGVHITGQYETEVEALEQIRDIEPDLILIPSIWHETFCYALSMAFKLKVPPIVFDIGAQAERVAEIRWGLRFPLSYAYNPVRMSDALLSLDIDKLWEARE